MNRHLDHLNHGAPHQMSHAKDKTHVMEHGEHVDIKGQQTLVYNVNLQTDPTKPMANAATQIAIIVTEQAVGDAIDEFELVHDKPMHLIIVRDDLSYFDHLHLEPQNGAFTTAYSFPQAGDYIGQDVHDFLHVHPDEEVPSNWRGGPDATFHAQFPKAGMYKTWVQFQHHGKTITADFVIEVK